MSTYNGSRVEELENILGALIDAYDIQSCIPGWEVMEEVEELFEDARRVLSQEEVEEGE